VEEFEDEGTLVVEQRFAIVPEWVLDADISDAALRLYAVLVRYGQTSGQRMPGRRLLASRLRKRSRDSVDRALKELVAIGAVLVQHRRHGQVNLTNCYLVRSTPPQRPVNTGVDEVDAEPTVATPSGRPGSHGDTERPRGKPHICGHPWPHGCGHPGRRFAAQPRGSYPEGTTPSPSPSRGRGSSPPAEEDELRRLLGVEDVAQVAVECRAARRRLGQATGLWTTPAVTRVLHRSVVEHGWPADAAVPAVLALAADPETRGPGRLPCAGPWWEAAERGHSPAGDDASDDELANLEARLAEVDGHRVRVQRLARERLTSEGAVLTRLGVARRACALLDQRSGTRTC
jgi:hypothetical protein